MLIGPAGRVAGRDGLSIMPSVLAIAKRCGRAPAKDHVLECVPDTPTEHQVANRVGF